MFRTVLDTNIVISALFWGGLPRAVFEAALDRKYILLTTEALTAELKRVLAYPKFAEQIANRGTDIERLASSYQTLAVTVIPGNIPSSIVRDPKDEAVIACAVGGKADFMVSGDKDLLVLNGYQNIPILSADQFLQRLSPA